MSRNIAQAVTVTFVRPDLELTSSVWNPHLENDLKTLESVQRRLTITKESHHLPYEKIFERLCLTDLITRRERGDFIQLNKIVHGLAKVNWCDENKILKPKMNFGDITLIHRKNMQNITTVSKIP